MQTYIRKELENGNLVKIKNRSNQVSERTAPIAAGYDENTSIDSISNSNKNVNTKSSKTVTAYSLDIEKKSADNGTLVTINKNKANNLLAPIGIQPSKRSRIINLAKDSISQYFEKSSGKRKHREPSLVQMNLENSVAWCFNALTQQCDISCELF